VAARVLSWHMQDRVDPARVLQEAWCVVRLDAIRNFVGEMIERLRQVPPQQLLGHAVTDPRGHSDMNPVGQAWQACADELRAESGMPDPHRLRSAHMALVVRRLATEPDWAAQYHEALDKYRSAAARDLSAWLDALLPARGR
jgi:hypothetical protein